MTGVRRPSRVGGTMYSPDESFVAATAHRERFSWARIFVTVVVISGFSAGAWWIYDLVR